MANKLNNTRHLNIALLGGDHFARQGIAALLKNIVPAMQITASIDNYMEIETILAAAPVDVIFLSGMEKYHAGYDCLKYIRKMKALYPQLTNSDLRLCACLKLNLETKEIASLMNLSVRAVENSRYRLRKKLNIQPSQNLNEFFLGID